jgi:hypothetical protein
MGRAYARYAVLHAAHPVDTYEKDICGSSLRPGPCNPNVSRFRHNDMNRCSVEDGHRSMRTVPIRVHDELTCAAHLTHYVPQTLVQADLFGFDLGDRRVTG